MDSQRDEAVASNTAAAAPTVLESQTASQYLDEQLALEADAKEILPYKFDKCTYDLGPLRQSVFACLTCSPPPASPAQVYTPAGICYGCSISCHGEHTLVELFKRRNFVCDCGTTRMPDTSPCLLRADSTGRKGVSLQKAADENTYNRNFQNKFCGCGEDYDPNTEKGTMYQCIGLATEDKGGCGEDWWHPECLMGLPRDWLKQNLAKPRSVKAEDIVEGVTEHPVPEGFPEDDDFSTLICYKCVESNPWIKQYAGTDGFLPAVPRQTLQPASEAQSATTVVNLKRKMSHDDTNRSASPTKRLKEEDEHEEKERQPTALLDESDAATLKAEDTTNPDGSDEPATSIGVPSTTLQIKHKHENLPPAPQGVISILAEDDFREKLCHCPKCFPNLIPHRQLQEEEEDYEPSLSASERSLVGGGSTRSVGTGSLLERGEAALSGMDRARAIEGVMAYNHMRDKVKQFLKPFAESGKEVSAEDIKSYFEKLRGDQEAVKEASQKPMPSKDGDGDGGNGDAHRREQSGY